jgi:hypothetical protein
MSEILHQASKAGDMRKATRRAEVKLLYKSSPLLFPHLGLRRPTIPYT